MIIVPISFAVILRDPAPLRDMILSNVSNERRRWQYARRIHQRILATKEHKNWGKIFFSPVSTFIYRGLSKKIKKED